MIRYAVYAGRRTRERGLGCGASSLPGRGSHACSLSNSAGLGGRGQAQGGLARVEEEGIVVLASPWNGSYGCPVHHSPREHRADRSAHRKPRRRRLASPSRSFASVNSLAPGSSSRRALGWSAMNFSNLLNPDEFPADPSTSAAAPSTSTAAPQSSPSRMSFDFLNASTSAPDSPALTVGDGYAGSAGASPSAFLLRPAEPPMQANSALDAVNPAMLGLHTAFGAGMVPPVARGASPVSVASVVPDSDDEGKRRQGADKGKGKAAMEEDVDVDILASGDEAGTVAALKAQARSPPAPKPRSRPGSTKPKPRPAHLTSSAPSPAPSPAPSSNLANEVHPDSQSVSAIQEPPVPLLPPISPSEYHHPRLSPSIPHRVLPDPFELYVPPRRKGPGGTIVDDSSSEEDEETRKRERQRRPQLAAQRRGKRDKRGKEEDEGEEEDDRLYCVCKELYDPERLMIACDKCEEWYHVDCVGISEDSVELVDVFICPKCSATSLDRTTWKPCCARPTCRHPAVPLSKYCSDYCGIYVVSSRLDLLQLDTGIAPEAFWDKVSGARRKEAEVVEVKPDAMDASNHEEARRAASFARQDASDAQVRAQLVAKLAEAASRRFKLEETIELVDKRLRYLTVAVKRWEALCQATADEMASAGIDLNAATPMSTQGGKSRKDRRRAGGKKKGPVAATSLPDAQCGLDVRLVYDDAAWRDFLASPFGTELLDAQAKGEAEKVLEMALGDLEGVCLETRKRCERHGGWQKVREADFAVEKAVLNRRLERVNLLSTSLSNQLATHDSIVSFRRANRSRTCPPSQLIPIEDFMIEREEEQEEERARRRPRQRSPSLGAGTNGVRGGGRANGSKSSRESADGGGGPGGEVEIPPELLPFLSRAEIAAYRKGR
ncbi:Set1 complex component spp1 [Rhodotorula toruloides]|nr:Set1 complex component spp1 [Rhodotorula toruloides]